MERDSSSASPSGRAAPRVKPLDWAQSAGKSEQVARGIADYVRSRRRRRRHSVVLGAATLAVVLATGFMWQRANLTSVTPTVAVTTTVSLPQRQTLPDGSLVELKSGAEIAVEFLAGSDGLRRVALRRGEAHFTVAKDPQRPFIVAAGGVEVRAVGTAFSVEWSAREVDVLVTEGRVAVDQPVASASSPAPLAEVDAGSRAVVALTAATKEARVETVTPTQLSERLAWRVPRLEFNATPLAEVIELFNRHAAPQPGGVTTKLVLADEKLRALPLSGVLRADNLAVLLKIMETSYGITAERRTEAEIVLRAAQ